MGLDAFESSRFRVRAVRGWRGPRSKVWQFLGFLGVLFCFDLACFGLQGLGNSTLDLRYLNSIPQPAEGFYSVYSFKAKLQVGSLGYIGLL